MTRAPTIGTVGWRYWVLRGLSIGAGAALLWLSLAVTAGAIYAKAAPDLALRFAPWNAEAHAARGAALATSPDAPPAALEAARKDALAALRRMPGDAVAVRTLGQVAALGNDDRRADRLFGYSQTLSRRDVPTQFWFIERAVSRGDVGAALVHYDRALRTSDTTRPVLFPILIAASNDPAIATPLGSVLAERPLWWRAFLEQKIASNGPVSSLLNLVRTARLHPDAQPDRDVLAQMLGHLIMIGAYAPAYRLYGVLKGARAHDLIHDGDFEQEPEFPGFDWLLTSRSGLAGVREARSGGSHGSALSLDAQGGSGGQVAQQLLMLAPGRYVLSGIAGDVPQDPARRPVVAVACTALGGTALLSGQPATTAHDGAHFALRLMIPARGCAAQWLSIAAGDDLAPDAPSAWFDDLSIRRE